MDQTCIINVVFGFLQERVGVEQKLVETNFYTLI